MGRRPCEPQSAVTGEGAEVTGPGASPKALSSLVPGAATLWLMEAADGSFTAPSLDGGGGVVEAEVSVTSLVASQSRQRSLAVEHVYHLRLRRHTTIFWFVCVYLCV